MPPVRVLFRRGERVESSHLVRVAVWESGRLRAAAGDPDAPLHLRSAAKPIQALACIVTGAADRFAMSPAELALAAASHNAEPFHTTAVTALLERLGLGLGDLLCGAHDPIHAPTHHGMIRRGERPSALHNNCSGKHAAMLAACLAAGWPTADYLLPDHPLQQLNRRHVAAFAGLDPEELVLSTDGCSVPVFSLPLAAAARGMARYTGEESPAVTPELRAGATRIAEAVAAHPEMIGGTGRIDTELARVTGGRVIAKVGAEGAWCLGLPGRGVGLAVECADGARRGATPVGLAVLRTLGAVTDDELTALGPLADPVIRNHRRLDVGRIELVPPGGIQP